MTETNAMAETNAPVAAVAALLTEARVVGYRPCFARAFGGAACAVLLSQFWFWTQTPTGQGPERGGWFWKSQREITAETGLSRRETETARRRLCALGVLQEEVRGIPATVHFRLDVAALTLRLRSLLEPPPPAAEAAPAPEFARNRQTSLHRCAKLVCTDAPNQFARTRQTIPETPSEISQKNICSQARPVLPAALEPREQKAPLILTPRQCQVNQQGTARLKDALRDAMRRAARSP